MIVIAQLNRDWRVCECDVGDPQWILQRRRVAKTSRSECWASRSYCRSRAALIDCARRHAGEIDVMALVTMMRLPKEIRRSSVHGEKKLIREALQQPR